MRNAIIRLDQDIADEALKYGSPSSLHYNKKNAEMYRKIAANGCVGSVAVIKQGILTLAHVGDTRVLIGKKSPEYDGWQSERLTPEHTLDNFLGWKKFSDICGTKLVVRAYELQRRVVLHYPVG